MADARSDVYAAGLMLFEMLTGTKAVDGDTAIHVAYQHVHGGMPSPSSRVARPRRRRSTSSSPPPRPATPTTDRRTPPPSSRSSGAPARSLTRRPWTPALRARLPSRRPPLPTATAALPMHRAGGSRPAVRRGRDPARTPTPAPRPAPTAAPLEGVVVAGPRRAPVVGTVAGGRPSWLGAHRRAHRVVLHPRPRRHGHRAVGRRAHPGRGRGRRCARPTCPPRSPRRSTRRVPKDQVISTDPGAGDTIRRGADGLARGVQGAGALRGAAGRRHDAGRGHHPHRGGQPRRRRRHARSSTRACPTARSSPPTPGRGRA